MSRQMCETVDQAAYYLLGRLHDVGPGQMIEADLNLDMDDTVRIVLLEDACDDQLAVYAVNRGFYDEGQPFDPGNLWQIVVGQVALGEFYLKAVEDYARSLEGGRHD